VFQVIDEENEINNQPVQLSVLLQLLLASLIGGIGISCTLFMMFFAFLSQSLLVLPYRDYSATLEIIAQEKESFSIKQLESLARYLMKGHEHFLFFYHHCYRFNKYSVGTFFTVSILGQMLSSAIFILVLVIRNLEHSVSLLIFLTIVLQLVSALFSIRLLIYSTNILYQPAKEVYKLFALFCIKRKWNQTKAYSISLKTRFKLQTYFEILYSRKFCFRFNCFGKISTKSMVTHVSAYSCLLMFLIPYVKRWKNL